MSLRLRRSSRAKPESAYSVGDIIEYKRRSKTGTGRLAFRLTEGDSPNPLWLLTFDGSNVKDEEIYEKHFTKVVQKGKKGGKVDGRKKRGKRGAGAKDEAAAKEEAIAAATGQATEGGIGHLPDDAKTNSTSSSDEKSSVGSGGKRKKGKTGAAAAGGGGDPADAEDDGAASDSSAPIPPTKRGGRGGRAGRASARAARSQRRQAMIEETVPEPDKKGGLKRAAPSGPGGAEDENDKKAKWSVDDEVVKVKMNTGTLYLYKGLNRRAVFVRKY